MRVRGRELHKGEHPQHFACFGCRRAFKQRGSRHPSHPPYDEPLRPFPCPNCKTPMVALGRDFKAPPQREKDQWLKVELLHSFGVTFEVPVYSPGGPGKRPGKLSEVVAFLVAQGRDQTEIEARLKEIRQLRAE